MREVEKKDIITEEEIEALENLVDVIKKSDIDNKIVKDDLEKDVGALKEKLKSKWWRINKENLINYIW